MCLIDSTHVVVMISTKLPQLTTCFELTKKYRGKSFAITSELKQLSHLNSSKIRNELAFLPDHPQETNTRCCVELRPKRRLIFC